MIVTFKATVLAEQLNVEEINYTTIQELLNRGNFTLGMVNQSLSSDAEPVILIREFAVQTNVEGGAEGAKPAEPATESGEQTSAESGSGSENATDSAS